jgi:hypothetical protein
MQEEIERLKKNKERRIVRDNQKKMKQDMPETPGGSQVKPGQTQRKCANCNQTGHIKTNKKLCPLLNGEWPNGVPPASEAGEASTPAPAATPSAAAATPTQNSLTAASPAPVASLPF